MPNYSFQVISDDDVLLPEHYLVLGEGRNVFNLVVDDLEGFIAKLRGHGVEVKAIHRLDDDPESVPGDLGEEYPILLPEEEPPGSHR